MTSLRLDGVSVRAGERVLVHDVSLEVRPGEFVALVGPNGAGKTTLLRAALGLTRPHAGTVTVRGQALGELDARARAAELAWLPQQAGTAEPIAVREAVAAGRYRFHETAAAGRAAAERALERVGLRDRSTATLSSLSGGERQRVRIAALLAQEARFLLLDEPANHLDPAQQAETYTLLGHLRDGGAGVLCVTHDVNLLNHVAGISRVVGLRDARQHFELDFRAPELPLRLSELFDVRMVALDVEGSRLIVAAPAGGRAP